MFQFKFPDVGEGITEGTIVKWRVKAGDDVKPDQVIGDVETDKAVVEIPCPKSGRILKVYKKEGETIKVGEILVEIEDGTSNIAATSPPKTEEHYTGSVVGFLEEAKDDSGLQSSLGTTVHKEAKLVAKATPKVRALAKKLGVDIEKIRGTGEEGRITEEDIQKMTSVKVPSIPGETSIPKGDFDVVPLKGIRKMVAVTMTQSMNSAVQVTNMQDADVTKLWDIRNMQKIAGESRGIKLTFLPYIIKACTDALKNNTIVNSSLDGDNILMKKSYNIGVAVDTDEGLMVPVIKNADKKQLLELAGEITVLAEKARNRTVSLDELKGGTFTISNLGTLGVKYFTPVINYPEAAILGVGSIFEQPAFDDGRIMNRKIMPLSFTYDHRIIDGANAAKFMKEVVTILEDANFRI